MEILRKLLKPTELGFDDLLETITTFTQDTYILTQYHHNYTIDQMIGIVKILQELYYTEESYRVKLEKYGNVSIGMRLELTLNRLYKAKEKEQNEDRDKQD